MKKLTLILMMMIPAFCWSQSTERHATDVTVPTNMEHLNIDFEVKNIPHPDENLVSQINFDHYDTLRQQDHDVEVHDEASGYILILYSNHKAFNRKKQNHSEPEHSVPNQH